MIKIILLYILSIEQLHKQNRVFSAFFIGEGGRNQIYEKYRRVMKR